MAKPQPQLSSKEIKKKIANLKKGVDASQVVIGMLDRAKAGSREARDLRIVLKAEIKSLEKKLAQAKQREAHEAAAAKQAQL